MERRSLLLSVALLTACGESTASDEGASSNATQGGDSDSSGGGDGSTHATRASDSGAADDDGGFLHALLRRLAGQLAV